MKEKSDKALVTLIFKNREKYEEKNGTDISYIK